MSDCDHKESAWQFPPDIAALLGLYYIIIPMALVGGWLGPAIYNARSIGDRSALWGALALGGIGTVLLFLARLPLYRERRFLALGPSALDARHRRLYWWAWCFIAASIALLALLILILR